MSTRLLFVTLVCASSWLSISGMALAETHLAEATLIENTVLNARDKGNATLTPEDQKENKQDIKITAKIRKLVVKHSSVSVNAQNVKIITRNGVVTLRGPVANEAESKKLQKIATNVRGVVQVDNQLEFIAP